MNRQILSRGKRADTGQWIEGYYSVYSDYRDNKYYQIRSSNGMHNDVTPETVGEFTGKTDNNGNNIFQHDILKDKDGNIGVVVWIEEWAMFGTLTDYEYPAYIKGGVKNLDESMFWSFPIEENVNIVIGNIHDNPELLNHKS